MCGHTPGRGPAGGPGADALARQACTGAQHPVATQPNLPAGLARLAKPAAIWGGGALPRCPSIRSTPSALRHWQGAGLALLWQIFIWAFFDELFTVRASYWWGFRDCVEDGVSDGWHGRLRGWSGDSFFPVPRP